MKTSETYPIDAVILWVDGNDENHQVHQPSLHFGGTDVVSTTTSSLVQPTEAEATATATTAYNTHHYGVNNENDVDN